MKKLLFLSVLLMLTQIGLSQVGINTTTPNAQLDIRSSNQVTPSNTDGILIPKIDAFPVTNPTAAQQGMMVYLTTVSAGKQPGFYYWDNVTASWLGLGGNSGWALSGNSGTNPATNFIGTTDATDVVFRRDNVISGKIGMANTSFGRGSMNPANSGIYNSAYGLNSMSGNTSGNSNSAFGNFALTNNTSGNANTAFGSNVMYTNTTGQQNTAFGSDALEYNTTGNNNSSVGYYSLHRNTSGNNNTANGYQALYENTTGGFNTALGSRALYFNKTGTVNTAVGDDALSKSDGAFLNVAVGGSSMLENSSGSYNTAVGAGSLRNSTNTNRNTAIGYESLYSSTGSGNTAVGHQSGQANTSGSNNITIGVSANVPVLTGDDQMSIGNVLYGADMFSTTTGKIGIGVPTPTEKLEVDGKTKTTTLQVTNGALAGRVLTSDAVGNATWQALGSGNSWLTTGNSGTNPTTNYIGTTDDNDIVFKRNNIISGQLRNLTTSYGVNALQISAGLNNVAFGTGALQSNTNGSNNAAFGLFALSANTTGSSNFAFGYNSMGSNTTASNNVAIGANSLAGQNFINGGVVFDTDNIAIGVAALGQNNPTLISNGIKNIGIGTFALSSNSTGKDNIGIGYDEISGSGGTGTITGSNNVGIGSSTLIDNNSGNSNIAVGLQSLFSNYSGSRNIAIGQETLNENISGSGNIAIGYQAGYNETGSNKLYIENSNSITPLIYGEFDTDLVKVYGNIKVDNITTAGNEMQVVNKNNFVHASGNQVMGSGGDDFIISSQENSPETGGVYGDGNAVTIWSAGDANQGQAAALVYFLDEDFFNAANTNPYDNTALKSYISPVGAYVQISDKNKKENIIKIENATEKVNQISGYTYQFKLAPSEIEKGDQPIQSSGVLAQELEKVLPEAVHKSESGDFFVDYAAITPLLIEAIKEQNATIKLLEERLNKLEKK